MLAGWVTLLLLATLCPSLAGAAGRSYEGRLQPDNRDPVIPISIEFEDTGTSLVGTVKTSGTLKDEVPIEYGSNSSGQCNLSVVLGAFMRLRLFGPCDAKTFSGYYTLYDAQRRASSRGKFLLTAKAPNAIAAPVDGRSGLKITPAACIKANTQCLAVCPQDDGNAELLCANRCRTKLRTCRAQIKSAATSAPVE